MIDFMKKPFQGKHTIQSNNFKSAKMSKFIDNSRENTRAESIGHSANRTRQFNLDYEAVQMKNNSKHVTSVILKAKQMVRRHKQFIYSEMYKMEKPPHNHKKCNLSRFC
jgi:hypothetical protein